MKFKTLVLSTALLLLFLSSSQAFGANLKKWEASCDIDKFTDVKYCKTIFDTFGGDDLYRIFFLVIYSQENVNEYGFVFSGGFKSSFCQNSNVIRIDKNDAIYFEGQDIDEDMARKLLEQMLAGKTAIARCGDVDFTFTLNGFPEGYEFVKKNMAFDPLKE